MVLGAGPAHSLYFGLYEMTKETLTKFTSHNHLNYGLLSNIFNIGRSINYCAIVSSNFGLFCDTSARCHFYANGGYKAAHANVQLSIYLGYKVHAGRLHERGYARLLSLLRHSARHEYTISDDSLYDL